MLLAQQHIWSEGRAATVEELRAMSYVREVSSVMRVEGETE